MGCAYIRAAPAGAGPRVGHTLVETIRAAVPGTSGSVFASKVWHGLRATDKSQPSAWTVTISAVHCDPATRRYLRPPIQPLLEMDSVLSTGIDPTRCMGEKFKILSISCT